MKKIILKGTKKEKAEQFYKLITTGRTRSFKKDEIWYQKYDDDYLNEM